MFDTTPEMAEKMRQMIQKKLPAERLRMGYSMYETAKYLMIRAILEGNPHISETALRQELFLRFYGNDFCSEEREKIIRHFEKSYS